MSFYLMTINICDYFRDLDIFYMFVYYLIFQGAYIRGRLIFGREFMLVSRGAYITGAYIRDYSYICMTLYIQYLDYSFVEQCNSLTFQAICDLKIHITHYLESLHKYTWDKSLLLSSARYIALNFHAATKLLVFCQPNCKSVLTKIQPFMT